MTSLHHKMTHTSSQGNQDLEDHFLTPLFINTGRNARDFDESFSQAAYAGIAFRHRAQGFSNGQDQESNVLFDPPNQITTS